ncbi:hypothetical protein AB0M46_05685 [Dactylosporangium sp. NPDC051485]|uniref:hypothetical protein n=1 Tax=Dactylosporangium sp. NPDC051485 TaxID=3154846 RepID=UPI003447D37F
MTLALTTTNLITLGDQAIIAYHLGDTDAYQAALNQMHDHGWGHYVDVIAAILTGDTPPNPEDFPEYYAGPVTVTADDLQTFHGEPPF